MDDVLTTETLETERPGGSLAVRYRPRRFAEVVGQRHVVAILEKAISFGRLEQNLLFSGPSGLGKTTLARITAAALLCETPIEERENGDACGVCDNCRDITTPGHTHPDVIEIDAASHGGKDEVRAIADSAHLFPMRAKRRVYIIDEVHGLSGAGGQAFLKLLEEPPEHVTFMLATTDPQKMLPTNRGRCTEFVLLAPSTEEMARNIQRVASGEGWTIEDESARVIIEASDPTLGVRATLMTLEKIAADLDDGTALSPSEIAARVGALPHEALAPLTGALTSFAGVEALHELALLRESAPDTLIRQSLVHWARNLLLGADSGSLDVARWRLRTLLQSGSTEGWLDYVVAELSTPTKLESAPAMLIEAESALTRLGALLGAAAAQERDILFEEPSTPTPTSSATKELSDDEVLEEFLARVGANTPKAVALLRSSHPAYADGVIRFTPKTENRAALAALAEPIRAVAAEMGITLRTPSGRQ
jgi:DNA polymerase-3 subunit gamma/tau